MIQYYNNMEKNQIDSIGSAHQIAGQRYILYIIHAYIM
jgi:hypothetical protein